MGLREWRDVLRRFTGRGTYPHQLAFLLELPLRSLVLSPSELARRLRLAEDSRVLEIGPGPGFFSREIARRVPRGRLELYDLQRPMLERARRRLARGDCRNAGFTQGNATALPFRRDAFDVVFLVAVLGEVPDPAACIREASRVLRPSGLLSVTELPGDPDYTPLAELRSIAAPCGLDLVEQIEKGRAFTASFRRRGAC